MRNPLTCGLLVGLIVIVNGGRLHAAPINMVTIGQTNPPIGHYEFCQNNPGHCKFNGKDYGPMSLTNAKWEKMLKVNGAVNRSIEPLTDQRIFGVEERWAYPVTVGDCEDYVLLKRKMLMQSGFSAANLLITVVLQPNGEGHAVLTVRTTDGDFILDNLRSGIRPWWQTEYAFMAEAGRWQSKRCGKSSIEKVGCGRSAKKVEKI